MDWLTDWDDLIHGTAVFSAAIPFILAFALTFSVPPRFWWAVVALALVPVAFWLFRFPKFPPTSSDDIVMFGLLSSVVILGFELAFQKGCQRPLRLLIRTAAFLAIGWSFYPAWLAADGDISRKWLICAGFAISIGLFSIVLEWISEEGKSGRFSITPAALIPPTIALAILLQTGGSMRFAQVTGALAAGLAAICLAVLLRRKPAGDPSEEGGKTAAFWGIMILVLGWSGWLFAEIRYGLAAILLCAPLLAALVNRIPFLPRQNPFLRMLWEVVAASIVAAPVALVTALEYAAEMAEFEGY